MAFFWAVGEIPESLGNLVNARKIFVNNNCIEGSIPASLGNLTNLRVRRATINTLYGTFLCLLLLVVRCISDRKDQQAYRLCYTLWLVVDGGMCGMCRVI